MQKQTIKCKEHIEQLSEAEEAQTFVWPLHLGQVHKKSDVKSDVYTWNAFT